VLTNRRDPAPNRARLGGSWYCVLAGAEVIRQIDKEDADVPLRRYKTNFRWDVSARRDGEYIRVFYRHDYPNGVEETRDTRRFNTLAEAEKFAETMRQVERFYRNPG
jgi:hypothetical protein